MGTHVRFLAFNQAILNWASLPWRQICTNLLNIQVCLLRIRDKVKQIPQEHGIAILSYKRWGYDLQIIN